MKWGPNFHAKPCAKLFPTGFGVSRRENPRNHSSPLHPRRTDYEEIDSSSIVSDQSNRIDDFDHCPSCPQLQRPLED